MAWEIGCWRWRAGLILAGAGLGACGPAKPAVKLAVQPLLVCPGGLTSVQWDVQGRARLRAARGAADWDQGEVPSHGRRDLAPAVTTTVTVTALDANRAKGDWQATQTVQVPSESDRQRAALAPCAAGVCAGAFTIDTPAGGLNVAKVSAPTATRAGTTTPVTLTVTHGGWSAIVPANGQTAAHVPAAGAWTLSMALPAEVAATPPPQLRVVLDFDCNRPTP